MAKHKILYTTIFPHIGGGETALFYLLEKLDRKKYTPVVIVTKPGQVSERFKKMGIETHILDLPKFLIRTLFIPGMSLSGILRFYRFIETHRPHIIHLNQPVLAVYAGIIGKLFRIPVVATSHGLWDSIYFYQDIINAVCLDRILPISSEVEYALIRRHIVPKKKIQVVPLGVDINKFKPTKNKTSAKKQWKIKATEIVVTMACRFDFGKNHITFLKVANDILQSVTNVRFVIVGDTKLNLEDENTMAHLVKKQLDDYINQHSTLKKHVVFTDFQEDMTAVYAATDILFSSSLAETLPVSYLEGASCGLPLIAIENVSTKWIVLHNKNGFLVPPQRQELLSKYLLELLQNKTLRKKFGFNAREHIVNTFTIEAYVKKITSVYENLL